MKKRMVLMLAAMGIFIVSIGLTKFFQIRAAIAQGMNWQPPPEAVTTIVVHEEEWPAALSAVGSVAAVHGVTVSADLPGIVEQITFDSGRRVRRGEVLVRLDTNQERAQLEAAKAQVELAELNLDRMRKLLQEQVVSQLEYDRQVAESKQWTARAKEIQATLDRKQIRAPFSGVLGIRQVNLGQYLNGGDPIVPLQSMDPVYVNFSMPQDDVGDLHVGAEVRISADSVEHVNAVGRITAINSVIDEATRNVQVQATLANPKGHLRPGMFVDVQVVLASKSSVIALPASAINYAPYGNSVYVVEEMTNPKGGGKYRGVSQRFVKLGAGRGDQIAVSGGLKPGDEVVTSGVFKLRAGAAITVDNASPPANNPAPKPEDS